MVKPWEFLLNPQTRAYLYWKEHKQILEDLVQESSRLLESSSGGSFSAFSGLSDWSESEWVKLQQKAQILAKEVSLFHKKSLESLPPSALTLLDQAESLSRNLNSKISCQLWSYSELEPIIRQKIKTWYGHEQNWSSLPQEQDLAEILGMCQKYHRLAYFDDQWLRKERGPSPVNRFYSDLSSLSFIFSQEKLAEVKEQYAQADSPASFKDFANSYENSFWKKLDQERKSLTQRYVTKKWWDFLRFWRKSGRKIALPEAQIINVAPLAGFSQIRSELNRILTDIEPYLKAKAEISAKIGSLQEQIQAFSAPIPALTENYVSLICSDDSPKSFAEEIDGRLPVDEEKSTYLQENIRKYRQTLAGLVQVKEQRRIDLIQMVSAQCHSLGKQIDQDIDAKDHSRFEEYKLAAGRFWNYSEKLGSEENQKNAQFLIDKIQRVLRYASYLAPMISAALALEHVASEKADEAFVSPLSTPEKEEIQESRGREERVVPRDLPFAEPVLLSEILPEKSLEESPSLPSLPFPLFPSFEREVDLVLAAYQYVSQAKDPGLVSFCRKVAGITAEGKYLPQALSERVRGEGYFGSGGYSSLQEAVSGLPEEEQKIYFHLQKGIEQFV